MRFALRNKTKLIQALGESHYHLLMDSLKRFFSANETIQAKEIEGERHSFIDVPSIQDAKCFRFAIIGKQYDVLKLAYYSTLNN